MAQSKYNPFSVRRTVRFTGETNDGIAVFASKSFTDASDNADKYHPSIDLVTGAVWCDCPHFEHRLAKHRPTVHTPETCCKHAQRAIANIKRHGEIQ